MANKQNYTWIGIAIIAVVILAIILISNSNNNSQNEVTCNSPYLKVGTECCLDQDSNNICDKDEESSQSQEYCGDGICQSNEKSPDCSDCKVELRIENLDYQILKPIGQYVELAITNYDVVQLGDSVVVYPSLDIYNGYSEQQCGDKDLMSLFKDDFSCPGGCYYIIDGDKKGKSYREDGTQLERPNLENPLCTYFVFELKEYPQPQPTPWYEQSTIESWESQIINI